MNYRLDAKTGNTVPCTVVQSVREPSKVLLVNADESSLVVLPDGTERSTTEPAGSGNWDSPWTQATQVGSFVIYQSSGGVCRTYRIVS